MKKTITLLLLFIAFQMNAQCWKTISSGTSYTLGIKTDGTLWAWGENASGQLGNGTTTNITTPTRVGTASDWVFVSAGYSTSFAIKSDGTLWGWGANTYGRIGDGTATTRLTPVQIGTATNWASVDSKNHTVAVKKDGTLWTWGFNSTGQLGDGTKSNTVYRYTPGQVGTDTNWQAAYAGGDFTMALKTNGTIWAWGYNNTGQLGIGTWVEKLTPTQVGSATDWQKLSSGNGHSLAIKTDGTLWAWGARDYGQIGNGTISGSGINTPVQIGMDTDWKNVSATTTHSLAVKTTGTLWAWGNNSKGQVGDGSTTTRSAPVQAGIATDWSDVAFSRGQTSGALKTDGSLLAWGYNGYGQIGDGTINTGARSTPTGITCPVTLSAEEFSEALAFSVYPNPTSEFLFIKNSTDLPIDIISIIDLTGKKVFEQKNINTSINVQQLESGIYILQITSEGKSYFYKFIKG